MPILQETAPLLILHDAWMGDFIQGWRHAAGDDMRRVDRLREALGNDPSGLGPLCALASGAVVHGSHYRAAVEAACPGPVATIPLSLTHEALPPPRPIGDRLVVTTIGYVNRNKQAEEVIRALGASERLRDRAVYMLVGPVESEEQERLMALARQVGAPNAELHRLGYR